MRPEVVDLVRERLEKDPRIRFALVFGSVARSRAHARSDLDLAIAAVPPLRALELGGLVADLEQIAGCPVDVVELDRAPAALAFRVFRDGTVLIDRDHQALLARKARDPRLPGLATDRAAVARRRTTADRPWSTVTSRCARSRRSTTR
jgi:uncharacterized protein